MPIESLDAAQQLAVVPAVDQHLRGNVCVSIILRHHAVPRDSAPAYATSLLCVFLFSRTKQKRVYSFGGRAPQNSRMYRSGQSIDDSAAMHNPHVFHKACAKPRQRQVCVCVLWECRGNIKPE